MTPKSLCLSFKTSRIMSLFESKTNKFKEAHFVTNYLYFDYHQQHPHHHPYPNHQHHQNLDDKGDCRELFANIKELR